MYFGNKHLNITHYIRPFLSFGCLQLKSTGKSNGCVEFLLDGSPSISTNWISGYDQTVKNNDGSSTNTVLTSLTRLDLSARTELSEDISMSLSLLNLLADSQTQTDNVIMAGGGLGSYSKAPEITYRSVYLRLNWKF